MSKIPPTIESNLDTLINLFLSSNDGRHQVEVYLRKNFSFSVEKSIKWADFIGELAKKHKKESPETVKIEEEDGASVVTADVKTLKELLKVCEVDPKEWVVESHSIVKTEGVIKENGEQKYKPKFEVRARLTRRHSEVVEDSVQQFKELVSEFRPLGFNSVKPEPVVGDRLFEISIPDLHLGKYAWGEETGYENYDTDAACELYTAALMDLVAKVDLSTVGEILLPIGNDFFNVDNEAQTTFNGTKQDEDGRVHKSFKTGLQLITGAVEFLAKHNKVRVVIVPGNHDKTRAAYLGEAVSAFFHNHGNVSVDNAPTLRKYIRFGKNLIGYTHGNEEKMGDLPILMANERKHDWAQTKYRFFHLGHWHSESLKDVGGVKVRVIPSLCPPDAWHAAKGYVMSTRSAEAFLYCPNTGLIANYYFNI